MSEPTCCDYLNKENNPKKVKQSLRRPTASASDYGPRVADDASEPWEY